MPKAKVEKSTTKMRHNPLAQQIMEEEDSRNLRKTPRNKRRQEKDEDAEVGIPAKVTQSLLELAQAQKSEEAALDGTVGATTGPGDLLMDDGLVDGAGVEQEGVDDVDVDEEGFVVTQGATEEEERALAMFMPGKDAKKAGQTLADVILGKIQDADARKRGELGPQDASAEAAQEGLSPKVVQVYTDIGDWLKHYKSGKLPKAFKIIPNLMNWEEVLSLTDPLSWTPAAMYEAVVIFSSNLNPKMAQRFYNLVLLPAIRGNIARYKKLNFHYFRALHRAFFKPAAFFKGIMLPIASESCTLKEAAIIGSILTKASIPVMHSAACIIRLCEMTPWYGTTSIFLATLVNKKYALPLRVVEALVAHFCAFAQSDVVLPVVWHRSLLLFVQRYKYELNDDQKRRIKELLKVHMHDGIGPEVRRELIAPKPGEAPASSARPSGMDIDMS